MLDHTFFPSLAQARSITRTHRYIHTHSAAVNLYACDSQVNKVTCLCTLPEKLFFKDFSSLQLPGDILSSPPSKLYPHWDVFVMLSPQAMRLAPSH